MEVMKSISISGRPGVGKSTLAKLLSKKLSMEFIDGGDMVKLMAKKAGYNPGGDDWWDTDDGMEFLKKRDEDNSFDKKVDQMMVEKYQSGGIICTSYTIPWLASGGCKIWLDGRPDVIAERISIRDKINNNEAYKIANDRYLKNSALYKTIYGYDYVYDLDIFDGKILTDSLNIAQVVNAAILIYES